MKYLFIAEKPSEMRSVEMAYKKNKSIVEKAIGGSIDFIALAGHVFRNITPREYEKWDLSWNELYESYLPMVPSEWRISPIESNKDIVARLKKTIKENKYDGIIVGTDSDVEGYGIYYLVCKALKLENYKTLRFFATSLAEKDIVKSLTTMTDYYADAKHQNAVKAYLFRSRWDWLIGMNFSVVYTVHNSNLMRVGSVKSPTLKLIYDNCKAIDEFVPHTGYAVSCIYKDKIQGTYTEDDKNEFKYDNKADAEKLISLLGDKATVIKVKKSTAQTKAPKLFSLSDLQIEASSKFGYSPDKTLDIAQKLYEERKILSYPRTSCNYVTEEKAKEFQYLLNSIAAIPDIMGFVNAIQPKDIKRAQSDNNITNNAEVAKASHDALLPTGEKVDWNILSEDEKNIFLLVCKRFVGHFMENLLEEKISVLTDNNGYHFLTNGKKVLVHGWKALYETSPKNENIITVQEGSTIDIIDKTTEERTTQPPKRYTTGTIIGAMKSIGKYVDDPHLKRIMKEGSGIGTEATRAGIIASLAEVVHNKKGYIEIKKNAIYITDSGKAYIENMYRGVPHDNDTTIANPFTVAYWSGKTKALELGEEKFDDVMSEFLSYLNTTINTVKASERVKREFEPKEVNILGKCPVCGNDIIKGKFGPYCSGKCGFKCDKVLGKTLTDNQIKSLLAGKQLNLRGLTKKNGDKYDASVKMNGYTEFKSGDKIYYYPKTEFVKE